jgi:hypothetical protein
VRSLADAVLFKFGSSRPRDLYLRDHIGRWQPQLRTFFVMFKYLESRELTEPVN